MQRIFNRWIGLSAVVVVVLAIATTALIALNARALAVAPIVWTQFGADGAVSARAITTDAQCPPITLGATTTTMQTRATPSSDFPVLTCETTIPPGVTSASINGVALALPKPNPRRIALIGDTGCRLKGASIQACNDPQQSPLARVAQSIAAWQPDVIIHVGDFHLRETACPPGNAGCAGPFGYNWDTMNAEFFAPVAPALNAAPWGSRAAITKTAIAPAKRGSVFGSRVQRRRVPITPSRTRFHSAISRC